MKKRWVQGLLCGPGSRQRGRKPGTWLRKWKGGDSVIKPQVGGPRLWQLMAALNEAKSIF